LEIVLESETDIRDIPAILGNNNSKTTEIETQVVTNQIKSIINPLNSIYLMDKVRGKRKF
jgi:site-specific recombinase XerD